MFNPVYYTQCSNHLISVFCSFTGDMLGDIMILVLRNNDFEKASVIMEKLDKNHNVVVGVPKIEALSLYVDECINKKLPSQAIVSKHF